MTNDHEPSIPTQPHLGNASNVILNNNITSQSHFSVEDPPEQLVGYIQMLESQLGEKIKEIKETRLEKDMQMKNLFQKLLAVENDLTREKKRMSNMLDSKEKTIIKQREKIAQLQDTNTRLLAGLQRLKIHYSSQSGRSGRGGRTDGEPDSCDEVALGSPILRSPGRTTNVNNNAKRSIL